MADEQEPVRFDLPRSVTFHSSSRVAEDGTRYTMNFPKPTPGLNEDERLELLASHPNDPRVNPRNVTIDVTMPDGITYPGTVDEHGVLVVHTNGARDNAGVVTPKMLGELPAELLVPAEKLNVPEPFAPEWEAPPWNWCPECDGPAQCRVGTCCGAGYPEGWVPEDGFMIIEACYCGAYGIRHRRGGPNCVAVHTDGEGNHDFRTCPCASCTSLRAKVERSEREQ